MKLHIINLPGDTDESRIKQLVAELNDLGFITSLGQDHNPDLPDNCNLEIGSHPARSMAALLEETICSLPLEFDSLPLITEGESKIIRKWTNGVVVEKFKPTVYSYTHNRYGIVSGTEIIRTHFTAEVFRKMEMINPSASFRPQSAFLAEISSPTGPLIVQRLIEPSNLEVRIKRYHIGSPVHRYRYTEEYNSTSSCGPLRPWSRFDIPLVCFDWRHPLTDKAGNRLADEPISDDYATMWMHNVPHAKEMARETFLWLEDMFSEQGILLIDMCIFIDKSGKIIYGEISPDCMRTRMTKNDPTLSQPLDKDLWREGKSPEDLLKYYEIAYQLLFKSQKRRTHEDRSLNPSFYTLYTWYNVVNLKTSCNNQFFFKVGFIPKKTGIYSLNPGLIAEACPNKVIRDYYTSSFVFDLADCNKDIWLSIPPPARGESDPGYTERVIDRKEIFVFKVE